MTLDRRQLVELAERLTTVVGVVGVVLGGSRARGDHTRASDVDLGVYYRARLDTTGLGGLARTVGGLHARVTAPGEWGPWVDGGGWLTVAGTPVDWIYRDLDRVVGVWEDSVRGRYAFHSQIGHPLGFPDFAYVGELILAVVLADPTGELSRLRDRMQTYPAALGGELVRRSLWEASFLIELGHKAVPRSDTAYVAGCLFRVVGLCAHALHGHAGRWLVNEKGAVTSAGRLPGAPAGFAARGHGLLAAPGTTRMELSGALHRAADLVRDTATACRHALDDDPDDAI